ncbi:DUF1937 family protein [Halodesulfovibrio aestuarii]|uniref:DUF1937 family protein n=1 Tax=Halodesulfovibrio aestuarii TaxID=126333 RepID=A0A8G2F8X9_9BACT|nr:DUF1937 family protein [Halodesulfovibrio aestuarii]SHJ07181.1 protein of unknown function [Halodesulfovibrio aestuarii]
MINLLLTCPDINSNSSNELIQFNIVSRTVAQIMSNGMGVFSPALHKYSIEKNSKSSLESSFWKQFHSSFLSWADALLVLDLPEVDNCFEVQEVITIFRNAEKPVRFITPDLSNAQLGVLLSDLTIKQHTQLGVSCQALQDLPTIN